MPSSTVPQDSSLRTMDARDFANFRELIHRQTGIWLRDGKQIMLASRLSRRLRHHGINSFSDYFTYLSGAKDSSGELSELINCVTTNKTSFFRESYHFDFLQRTLIDDTMKQSVPGSTKLMRVWSAACSTGQEPYSIAISLLERFRSLGSGWSAEVIASDIDTAVLETAQAGIYDEEGLESVDAALRGRYFLRGKGHLAGRVKIKEEVSRMVQFKRINLMDAVWPIEGPLDAIFFRNALIYFNQETQSLFLRRMCRYLKPKGYLFLGHSENVPWLYDTVQPLARTVYQVLDRDSVQGRSPC